MDDFLKYFENKDFVQWVLNPNAELDTYWQNYIKDSPQEEEQIKKSRLIILALKSKKTLRSNNQLDAVYSNILREIKSQKKTKPVRKLFFTVLKYASVFLLFISISVSYYYYQKANELNKIANQLIEGVDQNNSQLILANGNKVLISEKESEIEYGNNGEIVINKNDTLNYKKEANTTKQQYNQLIVPFGKKSSITLSDGTIVHINAGSRLIYPATFMGSKREVFLYGEGFFEVSHNKKKPFIVKTNNQSIEVLGTKFNVSAYPSDKIVETVLAEGSVKLKPNEFSFFQDDYILKPNQKANYNIGSKEVSVSQVNASKYVSWYLGYLNFETSELKQLVKRVERYYNIKIDIQNKNDDAISKTITGKLLLKDNVETVLKVLATATGMELIKINEITYVLK
ncbi:FecR family protein [Mariniflexile fucanivorans]|uniref:FecR family protein n=1 Tax=Mariniflexile fucanivorans TaxID=264023 RepID=A0A4R1RJC4_9FLAO|nr:FecR family protein [Mariniflexile fucanivorans]TCL66235.1 FecR family protein [Mariniflexile fucanivorans]